jgi:orotate phosphoribosyltransferase
VQILEIKKQKEDVCRILVKTGALRFGTFTLTSGKMSSYYIDLRILPSFPEAFDVVTSIYESIARGQIGVDKFDRIAGLPTAGIPYGAILAFRTKKPFLYVRKEAKTHGRERRVEGLLSPGDVVLVVDDLVTTGKSTLEAVDAVRCEGGVVNDTVVLIDREEGGLDALKDAGVRLHAFLRITEVAETLFKIGLIESKQFEDIMKQKAT